MVILPLFFQKYEAKKKASFPSPFVAPAILEEQIEEQKGGPDQDSNLRECDFNSDASNSVGMMKVKTLAIEGTSLSF